MSVMSQFETSITESKEFSIITKESCKNEIIPKEAWEKFKRITQRNDNSNRISLKELKGMGELLGKEMTRTLYLVIEVKTQRIFGAYTTAENAKKQLKKITKSENYQLEKDENLGLKMF